MAGAWLRDRAKPGTDGTMTVAVDGKVLRGAWTGDNEKFTLFSAMIHEAGVTLVQVQVQVQVQVPAGANEITQVDALLDALPVRDGEGTVLTMDAERTRHDTAEHIAGRGFTYVMNVKGNQPTLRDAVFARCLPLLKTEPHHVEEERSHGRINRWSTWITDAGGITFPHARTVGCIRRETFNLAENRTRKELAWIISGNPDNQKQIAEPEHLHRLVRQHWGIENKSHYVRDVTFHEDAHQAHAANGPRVMATLRNTAAGLIRLAGQTAIKQTTERIARNPFRALTIIATQRNHDYLT